MSETIKNRYDFMLIFDVKDGNPNGDPDAGNMPRVDAETGEGLVTDVCLKRKIRNFVQLTRNQIAGFDIFIKEKAILNNQIAAAYQKLGIELNESAEKEGEEKGKKGKKSTAENINKARNQMCADFYDIRTFGAVMTTGANAGQVRGPVQLTFARSLNPIVAQEHSITRVAITKADDAENKNTEMGRKHTVPYGLYVAYGFISPALAAQTGFSEVDLELLWEALVNMFDHDHSAARGMMATRKLVIFKHESELGNAPSHKLFDLVNISEKNGITVPRKYADYDICINDAKCPEGITIIEK